MTRQDGELGLGEHDVAPHRRVGDRLQPPTIEDGAGKDAQSTPADIHRGDGDGDGDLPSAAPLQPGDERIAIDGGGCRHDLRRYRRVGQVLARDLGKFRVRA